MGRVPPLRPREVIAILTSLGFVEVRQRGSHKQFRHPDGRGTTVPDHGGRDISSVLIRQIAKDIGLSADDFIALRLERAMGL
ncbi:MAG: type II toxin-antitoxin system HicA family toxin, partial [Gemmatimonadaceae bacterium]